MRVRNCSEKVSLFVLKTKYVCSIIGLRFCCGDFGQFEYFTDPFCYLSVDIVFLVFLRANHCAKMFVEFGCNVYRCQLKEFFGWLFSLRLYNNPTLLGIWEIPRIWTNCSKSVPPFLYFTQRARSARVVSKPTLLYAWSCLWCCYLIDNYWGEQHYWI